MIAALLLIATQDQEWTPLFDGKSLSGWTIQGKDANRGFWTVQDGNIVCDSMDADRHSSVWLVHDQTFADFELKLRFMAYKSSPGNSGVQIRSRFTNRMDGPQIDIHPPAPFRTGLIYDETLGHQRWIFPDRPNSGLQSEHAPKPRGFIFHYTVAEPSWNDLTIRCEGTKIRTTLNGTVRADYDGAGVIDDEKHQARGVGMKGQIALQLHANNKLLLRFRDLMIREL
jgi:hypothetical protein